MPDHTLPQVLLLLGTAVAVVVAFQRLHAPSSLGYLLIGIVLGPHTAGPVIDVAPVRALAEFGLVFLLFTIGLNFSLPQIRALRNLVLGLGTAQVSLTTAIVAAFAWLLGLPPVAAFVVGAVFAQSSTTIIGKQLAEQGEEHSRHGRLGLAMSVFQDVTAVPFVVAIPVLGSSALGASALGAALGGAIVKAALAFAIVFLVGRWALRPLFHAVTQRRSAEVFTLTVLFVALAAAWTTNVLGLSLAFGAFLVGMMLGETEFRLQVESAIRPFRDVLLGLFFVGIGMLFDPSSLPGIWLWVLAGTTLLVAVKTLLVAQIVRMAKIDALVAWRTGWLLAVGGEFGFALVAIALDAGAIETEPAQVALMSVLVSMILGPFLIRYNHVLAGMLTPRRGAEDAAQRQTRESMAGLRDHVIICGYGRIGQTVARFLEQEHIRYIALDLDPARVRDAHLAGEPVFFGDAAERDMLEAVGLGVARLIVISHEDVGAALKVLHHVRTLRPGLRVMVRTRDETHVEELRAAGATEIVPETREASLMIAVHALLLVDVPISRVVRRLQEQHTGRYQLLRGLFEGDTPLEDAPRDRNADRLRPVVLPADCAAAGRKLAELALDGVAVTALVRGGVRRLSPELGTTLEEGDVVVLFGPPEDLERAERTLLG